MGLTRSVGEAVFSVTAVVFLGAWSRPALAQMPSQPAAAPGAPSLPKATAPATPGPAAGATSAGGGAAGVATASPLPSKGPTDAERARECALDFATPPRDNGQFSADGKDLYLLAQVADSKGHRGAVKAARPTSKVKYTMFHVDLGTQKAEAVMALTQRPNAGFGVWGTPAAAAFAVTYKDGTPSCPNGTAEIVAVPLASGGGKAVHLSGNLQMVNASDGVRLVDLDKMAILQTDPTTFQMAVVHKVKMPERSLFYDEAKHWWVGWHHDDGLRGLVAGVAPDSLKRVKLKDGDRLVQTNGRFAVARFNSAQNQIELTELEGWSRVSPPGHYKVTLPATTPVAGAAVNVIFDQHLMLVFGATLQAKQQWQKAFLFDYSKGKPLATVTASSNQYLAFSGLDPTGMAAFFEVRDQGSRLTVGGKLLKVATRTISPVDLASP